MRQRLDKRDTGIQELHGDKGYIGERTDKEDRRYMGDKGDGGDKGYMGDKGDGGDKGYMGDRERRERHG